MGSRLNRKEKWDEEINENNPEPSSPQEDEQLLSKILTKIKEKINKNKEKGKKKKDTKEETISFQNSRRSSRLQGKVKRVTSREAQFINLEEETLVQSPDSIPSEHSPQNSPPRDFEGSPSRASPGIDPIQQQIYDYIESFEKKNTLIDLGTSTNPEQPVTPQETLTNSLKQEIFELEILNRNIQKENETLREQNKLDRAIHDNTMLHLGLWYKKNRKLKRKNKKLNRTLINLKYRLLMKKPRMPVSAKRCKKRKLDVLAEVSKQMK